MRGYSFGLPEPNVVCGIFVPSGCQDGVLHKDHSDVFIFWITLIKSKLVLIIFGR